ncbi:MAG: serine hydrolase [Proteobacteria bacterium]|nr:serine hydrolase [Pseudomonadota bacterium]MDA1058399.1 serine hydrolase [Pseudomonadota bacterium]
MSAPKPKIEGTCDGRFAAVKQAFIENFAEHDEIGASVAVYLDGEPVVDMWGGFRDAARQTPWAQDTLCASFSVSKAFVSVMGHMLIDRGLLDIDKPVAHYWPEFAQNDKADVLVRHIFEHRAALAYVDATLKPGDIYDWDTMTDALAKSARHPPFDKQPTYLNLTYGYLLGEVIRRIDGRTIGPFLREAIAKPLGVDFAFGLTDAQIARCAAIVPESPPQGATLPAPADMAALTKSMQGLAEGDGRFNLAGFRKSEIGAGSGHGTARGVAKFFACLAAGGRLDGVRLMKTETRDRAIAYTGESVDAIFGAHNKYASGFLLNNPPGAPMGPNSQAFGHPGAGGRIGFADPVSGLAFAYLPNLMYWGAGLGPRGTRLVEAAFASL